MMTRQLKIVVPMHGAQNAVVCIKAIRALYGLGLKEAKDIYDKHGSYYIGESQYDAGTAEFEDNCRILRNYGFQVGPAVEEILRSLRKLASEALLQGEDELANEILQMVLAEKLRRNVNLSEDQQ
jgi:hypothetical protein